MLKGYREYKEINLPWLRAIPSNWDILRNKNVMSEQKNIVGEDSNNYTLLSLTLKGIIKRDLENAKGKFPKEFDTYKIVNSGDIIFCLFDIDETPRTVGLAEQNGMITGAYDVFATNNKFINKYYLYYYYLSLDNIKALKPLYTGLRKVINPSSFNGIKLPIPTRTEQDQIVRYLDWKVSLINKYINAKKKQIELLKEYFSKRITDLLFNNTDSFIKMKHLSEYRLQYGANASGIDYTDKFPRYIRITDINNDGSLKEDDILSLNVSNYKDYLLENGDILFARSGATVGKTFIYKSEYGKSCFAGYLIRIIPNKKLVIPEYLYYFTLSSNYTEWLKQVFIQTTIQNISAEKYKELDIPFTSLEKQVELVSKIQNELGSNEKIVKGIEKEIKLLQEYRIRLISDVVTGKVDVQGIRVPENVINNIDEDSEEKIEND